MSVQPYVGYVEWNVSEGPEQVLFDAPCDASPDEAFWILVSILRKGYDENWNILRIKKFVDDATVWVQSIP